MQSLAVRLKRITDDNDLRILFSVLVVLSGGMIVSPSTGLVRLFGYSLPSVCLFQHLTGLDCPGCGLTRSLIFALHGQFYQSYLMHLWGIPAAIVLLFQIPYRLYVVLAPSASRFSVPSSLRPWVNRTVFLSLLLPWAAKTSFVLYLRYL